MDRMPPAELNISSRQDQRQFLKVIYEDFLQVVDPGCSLFLDKLHVTDLFTDTDLESVSGKDVPTRKEQARKVWILLNKVSVDDFKTTVYPALCQEYPHILPREFPGQEMGQSRASMKNCFRHDIMRRIHLDSWLDLLYQKDCLSFEDFETMVSIKGRQTEIWDKAFQSLKEHEQGLMRTELVGGIKSLLTKYKVNMPRDLEIHVSHGIPCTCEQPAGSNVLPHFPANPQRKVNFWLKTRSVNRQYDSETSSSATSLLPASSQNLSSIDCSTSSIPSNNNDKDSQSVISSTCHPSFDQAVMEMDELSVEKSSEDGSSVSIKMGENDDEKMPLNSCLYISSCCSGAALEEDKASESIQDNSDNAGTTEQLPGSKMSLFSKAVHFTKRLVKLFSNRVYVMVFMFLVGMLALLLLHPYVVSFFKAVVHCMLDHEERLKAQEKELQKLYDLMHNMTG